VDPSLSPLASSSFVVT